MSSGFTVNGAHHDITDTGDVIRPHQVQRGQLNGHSGVEGRPSDRRFSDLTVFEQIEAIVDSACYTASQKCILIKIRIRANSATMYGAIVSLEGVLRAASLKDPRAARAEMRVLQGKSRELPDGRDARGRPLHDPIDQSHATIVVEERRGKSSVVGFTPERLDAIAAAYEQHRALIESRRAGRPRWSEKPPAPDAPPYPQKPPASDAPPLSEKPPAPDAGGLKKPPASHAENPLRQTHPDPFPLSGREDSLVADAPASESGRSTSSSTRRPKATEVQFERFWVQYPKHEGKAAARKAFLALSPGDAEVAIRGAAAYASKCQTERKESKFIKMAQGWLNDRRFEDFAADPTARMMTFDEEVADVRARYPDLTDADVRALVARSREARGDD